MEKQSSEINLSGLAWDRTHAMQASTPMAWVQPQAKPLRYLFIYLFIERKKERNKQTNKLIWIQKGTSDIKHVFYTNESCPVFGSIVYNRALVKYTKLSLILLST